MAILVTSKYEEDPIKIESARVATTLNIDFSNTQRQIIRIKLIQDVTNVLLTSKNKEDPNKNEGTRVATTLNIDFTQSRADNSAVKG